MVPLLSARVDRIDKPDMAKTTSSFMLNAIALSASAPEPMHQQLYDALRDAILSCQLKPGSRLPSTRTLAADLGVSRNTVSSAFDQLLAEGYIDSRVGAGSYVNEKLPDELLTVSRAPTAPKRTTPAGARVSRRYLSVTGAPAGGCGETITARAFRTGVSAVDMFPTALWARLLARRVRHAPPNMLAYGDAAGYRPLREAIAEYLGNTRGLNCSADQVVITAASQEALTSIAQVLLNEGDEVWMEDPGYQGARSAMLGAGARLTPVPVDVDGMRIDLGESQAPRARLAYVTPSYQYPVGVTMSLARRLALLDWAQRADAWIIEDDYNSEYRYTGRPLAALQGLDTHHRVIYVGTFSKVMFGSLRIGYMVLPPQLAAVFVRARAYNHQFLSVIDQAVLTDFITEGHFARHIRNMRALYAGRREALVGAIAQHFGEALQINSAEAGLHVLAWLPPGVSDVALSQAAAARSIEAQPLSSYAMLPLIRGGLVLGYGALNERDIRSAVKKLREAYRPSQARFSAAPHPAAPLNATDTPIAD
jgi:GntR family transcriptional regulator / MocR family aminotransferase